MKVTEEAKGLLIEALKANDASCVLVREFKSCCGTQLNFSLAIAIEGDQIESISSLLRKPSSINQSLLRNESVDGVCDVRSNWVRNNSDDCV